MRHQATKHEHILDVTEEINHLVKVLKSDMERKEKLSTELRQFSDHKLKQPPAITELFCSTCVEEINEQRWKFSKMCVSYYKHNRKIECTTKRREQGTCKFTNNILICSSGKIQI